MKRLLFLCGNNASRSQMAEGIARKELGDQFEVFSAGIQPLAVDPLAVEDGYMPVPVGPGLGVDLDASAVAAYRLRTYDGHAGAAA